MQICAGVNYRFQAEVTLPRISLWHKSIVVEKGSLDEGEEDWVASRV
jgi:hypothetical protein